MGTTADKLLYLQDTKSAIKDAIVAKGVTVPTGTTFREYATKIGEITSGGSSGSYSRPTEWLALPDNVDGVQKISILNAVFDTDSELVALMCKGAYTVEWGDGTTENFASNIKAEHKYTYSDIDLNSDTVANFTYKQCIITITPQSGQNLTLINLNQYHTSIGNGTSYDLVTGFLDIRINALSCTTLVIGAIATSEYVQHMMLEQCVIGQIGNILNSSYMFYNCSSLQSVPLFNLASATDTSYMFATCSSLQSVPLFNLASATKTTVMFANCSSLQSVPLFNLASATDTSYMFQNCSSLQSVPLFNLASATKTSYMFRNCSSLQSVPVFNLASATDTSYMFQNCYSLQSVPLFNLSSITNNNTILLGCYSLKRMRMPLKFTFSVATAKMSATALNEMYSILPTVATTQTVTVTGNYGATSTPIIGLTGTTTNNSKVISMANTTGLSVGMFVSGTSTSTTTGFGVTITTGVVYIASHGLINGDIVSFSSVGGVVGITLNTIYYVVNAAIDTFQISLSVGGPAIVITGAGSGTCKTPAFITAINSNTNVTISTPVVNSVGTYTLSFRSNTHKTYLATMKNWTVTG